MSKKLLRKEMITELVIGDCLLEINRFSKSFRIYKLIQIEDSVCESDAYAVGEIVATNDGSRIGSSVSMELFAHTTHKNCTWLTYYLPAGKVLYGSVEKRET